MRHDRPPAVRWVDFCHGQGYVPGLFAQIFLVDRAILTSDKRHDSKRCPQHIQRELEQVNACVARSLEAGLEETLIVHRLEVRTECGRRHVPPTRTSPASPEFETFVEM